MRGRSFRRTAVAAAIGLAALGASPPAGAIAGGVSGTVLDPEGAPVGDACVWLMTPESQFWVSRDTTASDGSFRLSAGEGTYQVFVNDCYWGTYPRRFPGQWFDGAWVREEATEVAVAFVGDTTIQVVLRPGGMIAGAVTEAGGEPLAGICVGVAPVDWDAWSVFPDEPPYTETDADGRYLIHAVEPGEHLVQAWDCDGEQDFVWNFYGDAYFPEDAGHVIIADLQTTGGIDIEVERAGSIGGTVTGPDGGPLGNICVTVLDDRRRSLTWVPARTNADGAYVVGRLPSGAHHVLFSDCAGFRYDSEYYDDAVAFEGSTPVAVAAGVTTPGIDASLSLCLRSPDEDLDGLTRCEEIAAGTDHLRADTDGDHLDDGDEVKVTGTDPTDRDSDDDLFGDGFEVNGGSCPVTGDYPGGSDPNDGASTPLGDLPAHHGAGTDVLLCR